MQTVTLQIPVNKKLRDSAKRAASHQGFSSLQELLRVVMHKLAQNKLNLSIEETVVLSEKAQRRYDEIDQDIKKGKGIYKARSVDELMKHLHEDHKP